MIHGETIAIRRLRPRRGGTITAPMGRGMPQRRLGIVSTEGPVRPTEGGRQVESAKLFEHDICAAHSYRDSQRRERVPEGEWRIRQAVLLDAIDLLRKGAERVARNDPRDWGTAWRHEYAEARRWIASRDRGQPFAFELVCETLGLDPGRVRAVVLAEAPEINAPASHLQLVDPRTRAAHERLATRLWGWADAQQTPWSSNEAALAVHASPESVRGYVSYWIKTGRIEHYGDGGHGGHYSRGLATYRVVRRGR